MKNYYESTSEETYKEIEQFLKDHPENELDYCAAREAFKLMHKGFNERIKSLEASHEECERIVHEYKAKAMGKYSCFEIQFMNKTNKKFSDLYSEIVPNPEMDEVLNKLNSS